MAITIYTDDDGRTIIRILPPEGSHDYSDWASAMLAHGLAVEHVPNWQTGEGGKAVRFHNHTAMVDQTYHVDEAGNVTMNCVVCAIPMVSATILTGTTRGSRERQLAANKIRIGGTIFIYRNPPEPHPSKPNTLIKRPSAMTLMRLGYACPPCHDRYDQLVAAVNHHNTVVDEIATYNAQLEILTGKHRITPRRRTAYIDVFGIEKAQPK